MFQRSLIVRYLVPVVAMGALVLICTPRRACAAEADAGMQVAAATRRAAASERGTRAMRNASREEAPPALSRAPSSGNTPDFGEPRRREIDPADAWGQVSAAMVNVRGGPGTKFGIVITLKSADFVRARAAQDGWLEIDWPRDVPLWVPRKEVSVETHEGQRMAVAKSGLPLRARGIRSAASVVDLDKGEAIQIVGETNGWYRVKAPAAARAFISERYVVLGVQAPETARPAQPVLAESSAAGKLIAAVPGRNEADAQSAAVQTQTQTETAAKKPAAEPLPISVSATATPTASAASIQKPESPEAAAALPATESQKAPEPATTANAPVAVAPESASVKPSENLVADAPAAATTGATGSARLEEVPEALKRELADTVEDTRQRLAEAPPAPESLAAQPRPASAAPLILDDEGPRQGTVSLTREFQLGQENLDTRKLLDERAELEATQQRLRAEAQRLEAENSARQLDAARQMEALETACRKAEAEAAAEIEARRLASLAQAEQAKAKPAEPAQLAARPEAVLKTDGAPAGVFLEPEASAPAALAVSVAPAAPVVSVVPAEPAEIAQPRSAAPAEVAQLRSAPRLAVPLPEPRMARPAARDTDSAGVIYDDVPTRIVEDKGADAQLDFTPEAVKNVRSRFIVPAREPHRSGDRAEIIELPGDSIPAPLQSPLQSPLEATPTPASAPAEAIEPDAPHEVSAARPTPVTQVTQTASAAPVAPVAPVAPIARPAREAAPRIELPTPAHEAPPAQRLPAASGTLVRNVDEASGRIASDSGTLERAGWSPVSGAAYTLVQDGRVLRYLIARGQMDLGAFVGRTVQVTGTPVTGAGNEYSVLEVSSITAAD